MTMLVNGKQGYDRFHLGCDHDTPKQDKRVYKKQAKRREQREWKRDLHTAY